MAHTLVCYGLPWSSCCCFRVHCAAAPASSATKLGSGYVLAAILFYYYYTLYSQNGRKSFMLSQTKPEPEQSRAEQNNCYVCLSKTKLLLPARLPAWLTAWPHFRVSIAGCLSPWIAPPPIVCGIKENQMKRKLAKCKLFLPFNVKSFSVHNTFEWFGFLDCGKHTPTLVSSPTPHTLLSFCVYSKQL